MTREQRLKLVELLGLEQYYTDEYVFQPIGSTAKIYVAQGDSGVMRAGNYSRVDCRYGSLPTSYDDMLDKLLLSRVSQMIDKRDYDWRQIKDLLEEVRTTNNLGDNDD